MLRISKLPDSYIRSLAREYLKDFVTFSTLSKEKGCSKDTISKIIYKGIVESILDDITSTQIVKKVIATADNTAPTRNHWKRALKLREANELEPELEYLDKKLAELNFHLDSFDDVACEDSSRCSKDELIDELFKTRARFISLSNYIKNLRK